MAALRMSHSLPGGRGSGDGGGWINPTSWFGDGSAFGCATGCRRRSVVTAVCAAAAVGGMLLVAAHQLHTASGGAATSNRLLITTGGTSTGTSGTPPPVTATPHLLPVLPMPTQLVGSIQPGATLRGAPSLTLVGGRVRRVSYGDANRYGPFGYFTELERVCTAPENKAGDALLLAGGGGADGASAAASVAALVPFYPFGGINSVKPSVLGFHVHRIDVAPAPLAVPSTCWVPGATLAYENTVAVPGHIAHVSENLVKYLPIVAAMAATGRGTVDRLGVWHLHLPFPKIEYEFSLIHALVAPAAAAPPPVSMAHPAGAECDRVCYERLYWPEMASRYMASPAHADEVREAVWAYCGVTPADTAPRTKPTLMYLPRFNRRREVLNYPARLARAALHGFDPLPPPATRGCVGDRPRRAAQQHHVHAPRQRGD